MDLGYLLQDFSFIEINELLSLGRLFLLDSKMNFYLKRWLPSLLIADIDYVVAIPDIFWIRVNYYLNMTN